MNCGGEMKVEAAIKMSKEAPHMEFISEFSKWETAIGGPDVHLKNSGWLAKDTSLGSRYWMGGCYINVYNSAAAELLWMNFSWEDVLSNPDKLHNWIVEHRKGIITHRHRKCVYSAESLYEFYVDYAHWMQDVLDGKKSYTNQTYESPEVRYDMAWEDTQKSIKFLGRYSGIKLLEYFKQYCGMPIEMHDIRPVGGWSPRAMLAILYPEHAVKLFSKDTPEILALSNELGYKAREEIAATGTNLSMFELQVMLCDYKQCYLGKQFPGKCHDSEYAYWKKVIDYFGNSYESSSRMLECRRTAYPSEGIGEIQGWDYVRKELGLTVKNYGYMWSDIKYDYMASKSDLSNPVLRSTYA